MKKIYIMKNIIGAAIVIIILLWAFLKNMLIGKLMILPFLVCAISILGGNIAILIKKEKIAKVFNLIFKVSIFLYILGILSYTVYYAFVHRSYSLIIIVLIFVILGLLTLKNSRK